MIYPDNIYKSFWDIIVAFLLVFCVSVTPFHVIFYMHDDNKESGFWTLFNIYGDSIFLADIIITFFSAFHDDEYNIVHDRKLIAINYLKGWFCIDFIAIFPFQAVFQTDSDMNGVLRISRISRLWKILRLTRIVRLLKVI